MRTFIIFLFLLSHCICQGQDESFIGKIIYSQKIFAADADIANQLLSFWGAEQHYFINSGNYKAYNEEGELRQLYNSKTNLYYFVNPGNKDVMQLNASEKTSEIIEIKVLEEVEEVANIKCNKLVLTTDQDETTYWFSSEIQVVAENFKDHLFGQWGPLLERTGGALPLKYVIVSSDFTMESTAIKIERSELNDDEFDIQKMLNED